MAIVLIIDDDAAICSMLCNKAVRLGHEATSAQTLQQGLAQIEKHPCDVVFLDVNLPDGNGLDALPMVRQAPCAPEVVIITGEGDPDGAELAIKNDAWDYLQKPFSVKEIDLILTRAVQYRAEKDSGSTPLVLNRDEIIGSSVRLNECLERLAQMACSDGNVLITGETGTGKELFARSIHNNSHRSQNNFVVVDCAALPETLVESMLFGHDKGAFTGADKARAGLIHEADGGTLFLDEIGELPMHLQKAFLRLLQERRFRPLGTNKEQTSDFRLVAATNRNLEHMIAAGQFREDLFFRIRSLTLDLPPLRVRKADIRELALHYLVRLCDRYQLETKGVSPEFVETLVNYHWPGNVRELIHTIERALTVAGPEPTLYPRHLPTNIRVFVVRETVSRTTKPAGAPPEPARVFEGRLPLLKDYRNSLIADGEKNYLNELMRRTKGDIANACEISGLGRARLYGLMKKYQIARPE